MWGSLIFTDVQPTHNVERINFLIDIALITLTRNSFSFYQGTTLAEWRGKRGGQRDGAAGNTGTGVTVLTGHDPTGEGGPQQGNLKEAGLCLAGLQCKHVSGFCPGPDTAGPFFSFPFPASGHKESQLCFPEGRAANQCFLWRSELNWDRITTSSVGYISANGLTCHTLLGWQICFLCFL